MKSRSKIALFSNERHFEIRFPKKITITFFWSKLSKLHKNYPILHMAPSFSLKQGEIRTSHGPIPHPLRGKYNKIAGINSLTLHINIPSVFLVNLNTRGLLWFWIKFKQGVNQSRMSKQFVILSTVVGSFFFFFCRLLLVVLAGVLALLWKICLCKRTTWKRRENSMFIFLTGYCELQNTWNSLCHECLAMHPEFHWK